MNISEKIKTTLCENLAAMGCSNERDFIIKNQRYLGSPMGAFDKSESWTEGLIFESTKEEIYRAICNTAFFQEWSFNVKIYRLGETKFFAIEFVIQSNKIENQVTQTLI